MNRTSQNVIVTTISIGIPLVAEYVTAEPGNGPGTGFDILLYEPFDFAYFLVVSIIFVALNVRSSYRAVGGNALIQGTLYGIFCSLVWFAVSFLAVAQLHVSLGGKL